MMLTTKMLKIAVPVVLGVGVVAAVLLGGAQDKRQATIPEGTVLVAALESPVSTDHSRVGDRVQLRTVEPIRLADGAVIPTGVLIRGEVTGSKGGGRIAGAPELALRFSELEVDGDAHAIMAAPFRVTGRSDATKSAAQIGGGAVVGGIVGRVLGGKGATLKGAVVGAAIGTGAAVVTEGDQLVLPAGQKLTIRLNSSVTVLYWLRSESADEPGS